jgi:hypothetical protein
LGCEREGTEEVVDYLFTLAMVDYCLGGEEGVN